MILTTSRKPGRRTRSFAKVFSRFLNWRYVNRGKMNLEEVLSFGDVCIVQEVKGNPASMTFYRNGRKIGWIRFSAGVIKKVKTDFSPPVFIGKPPFNPLIFGAMPQNRAGMKIARKADLPKKIFVKRDGKTRLIFRFGDEIVLSMKIIDFDFQLS